ncbi:50S ribosomal protein L24 [bacterium]|nr:MAG: 50S ribosomal protein L24 [bacterium]QQR62034.1 MAG: 50S ribosomal protein L24 [bacterium]QQR62371.1 MAG: 50S ribosomal protein L24 [bacterium]
MISRIKKNDLVMVLSGKDKGKKGSVLVVFPKNERVLVQGINMATRHMKAKKQGQKSEIKKTESLIPLSKVMLVCSSCHNPSRVNVKITDENVRVRACNRCKQIT